MLAPSRTRCDEIVAEMLEVLNPAPGEYAAVALNVRRFVEMMRENETCWGLSSDSKQQKKKQARQLKSYRTRLLAVKRYRPDCWGLDDEFLAALDEQIKRVNEQIGPGKKPRDLVAEVAVRYAWTLLPRSKRKQTEGGAFHRLSLLLYEAGTGKSESGKLLNYMAEMMPAKRMSDLLRR
jgi:hypothetical protein